MLEKPTIDENLLICSLNDGYGKGMRCISFLPIGADLNTAVYKAQASDDTFYFVKLRRGAHEAAVLVPQFLFENGLKHVIPTLRAQSGDLWHHFDNWTVTLHPFIKGHHGYAQKLTTSQWEEFGATLKLLHTSHFPKQIIDKIPREKFSTQWQDELQVFLKKIEDEDFVDPIAVELASFLKSKKSEILELLQKLDQSLKILLHKTPEFILCHADIHLWNLLIEDQTEHLYIVDWDTLIFAPKERDLMFMGCGLADSGYTPDQETEMFYKGYGKSQIDDNAIKYYRCVRIVEDLVVYCQQIFLSNDGGEDRKQAVEAVRSNFRPNGTIDRAIRS